MRRSSVAKGIGFLSMVATDMPQQLSSIAVSGAPASTPVSGLPTSSARHSRRIEATPLPADRTFSPSALLWGMASQNHFWKSARRSSGLVRGLVSDFDMVPSTGKPVDLAGTRPPND